MYRSRVAQVSRYNKATVGRKRSALAVLSGVAGHLSREWFQLTGVCAGD